MQILTEVHAQFYQQHDASLKSKTSKITNVPLSPSNPLHNPLRPDVKSILSDIKAQVLNGVQICFSSVIPLNQDPTRSEIWNLARTFGAQCQSELDSYVTHLVAGKPGTEKVSKALRAGMHVVTVDW